MKLTTKPTLTALLIFIFVGAATNVRADDPLPSWNDTASKKAIVDFVEKVTKEGSPDFVKPEERIATFDNDGTLWVEQPIYTQVTFAIDEVIAKAPQHPDWRETEPFKSILAHDREAMLNFSIQDFEKVVAVTHSGMTVQQFREIVKKWLAEAEATAFQTALYRMRLSTYDRVDAIPSDQRVQDLYRHWRRTGVCSCLCREGLRCAS